MDIKDLAGLSQPLTRLIEVISNGIGAVSRPYLTRKNAAAKAQEIRLISSALKDVANQHHLPVIFKDGEVEIWQKPDDRTLSLENIDNSERANLRLDYQERKKQENIEKVTSSAAAELVNEHSVPAEKPDEDWITRFFNSAQDVTSDQMQELWGRMLAGEIKRPGSYSLKTLDFVRNMTKEDANHIETLAKFAINFRGSAFLACFDLDWLKNKRNIYPGHHFAGSEIGAMYPTDLSYRVFISPEDNEALFVSGNILLLIGRGEVTDEINLPVWSFTKVGKELLELTPTEGDEDYMENLGRFFLARKATAKLARIIEHLPSGQIRYQALRDVTPESPADSEHG